MSKRAYMVHRMIEETACDVGRIRLRQPDIGLIGMLPVFKTKTAARAFYGADIDGHISEIAIHEPQGEGE